MKTALGFLVTLLVAGCVSRDEPPQGSRSPAETPVPARLAMRTIDPLPLPQASPPAPSLAHTESHTYSKDRNADGIDDYRVTIVESYDAEGKLVSRTKEQDFDADGIVDSRNEVTFP